MKDIEKIKKIAKLSAELKKHGFAENMAEAMTKSEEVYEDKIPEGLPLPEESQTNETTKETDRFKAHVHSRIDKLESQMGKVVEKINEIIKEFKRLEERLVEKSGQKKEVAQSSPEPQKKIEPKAPEKKETSQRVGNYTSEEVSVDKVFYYGKK